MYKREHIPFQNFGDFLYWWIEKQRLTDQAQEILLSYYSNYKKDFCGYLKKAWNDRHVELDEGLTRFKSNENINILDLGCGTGSVSLYLAYRLQGKGKILGIDINRERLFCATERLKILRAEIKKDLDCDFRLENIIDFSPNTKFDLIYMEETFHHLEPRMKVIKKIKQILKENGLLIISEVNALNPLMQALMFKRRGLKTIVEKIDEQGNSILYGNERIIAPNELAKLFHVNGLGHISTRYFRLFNSSFAGIFGRYWDLMTIEKRLLRVGILKYLFTIHYNSVFTNI